MSARKRRDNKNRVLRTGESQLKDGRYMYKYVDGIGKTRYLYSWKLVKTDRNPTNKKGKSLREKEEDILQQDNQYNLDAEKIRIKDLTQRFLTLKEGVTKSSTLLSYKTGCDIINDDIISELSIARVKRSIVKGFFVRLQAKGYSYSTISSIKAILSLIFDLAIDDEIIENNPVRFRINSVIPNNSMKRKGLTLKEEERFLELLKNSDKLNYWYDAIYILFNTGLRISELLGLTIKDVNMIDDYIDINHQLYYIEKTFLVQTPKSVCGNRRVPMTKGVKKSFERILKRRNKIEENPEVDGVKDFVFLTKKNNVCSRNNMYDVFYKLRKKYNEKYGEDIVVSPHVCRHTFCSKMIKKGMNIKALQQIMGHSSTQMTLDIYSHVEYDDVKSEMARLDF